MPSLQPWIWGCYTEMTPQDIIAALEEAKGIYEMYKHSVLEHGLKVIFFLIAVYTQWSCLPVARLFSGLAVDPTRKHFGGGILVSGSISPTKIKALCERAGDSCCL